MYLEQSNSETDVTEWVDTKTRVRKGWELVFNRDRVQVWDERKSWIQVVEMATEQCECGRTHCIV